MSGEVRIFCTNLWVGSFATTTSIFRATNMVRDEKIPGTLNVGHTIPTFVEAIAATALFKTAIDTGTLIEMIAAAVISMRVPVSMAVLKSAVAAIASTNVGMVWPTLRVPGIFSSRTMFVARKIDVVVAKE